MTSISARATEDLYEARTSTAFWRGVPGATDRDARPVNERNSGVKFESNSVLRTDQYDETQENDPPLIAGPRSSSVTNQVLTSSSTRLKGTVIRTSDSEVHCNIRTPSGHLVEIVLPPDLFGDKMPHYGLDFELVFQNSNRSSMPTISFPPRFLRKELDQELRALLDGV